MVGPGCDLTPEPMLRSWWSPLSVQARTQPLRHAQEVLVDEAMNEHGRASMCVMARSP